VATTVQVVVNKASLDRFQFALNEFRLAAGISMRDGFIREAGFCCYEFMRYSPPMPKGGGQGLTKTAKLWGEEAVNVDIQTLFRPKEDPGAAFQKMGEAVSKGDLGGFLRWQGIAKGSMRKTANGWYKQKEGRDPRGIFQKILLGNNPQRDFQAFKNRFGSAFTAKEAPKETTDFAGIHKQFKDRYNGRIHKNKGPALNGMKYLVDGAKLKTYIELKKKAVGYLKGGWANTLMTLPAPKKTDGVQYASTSKVPAWITRNMGSNGYSRFAGNQTTGNFTLIIGNTQGDNEGRATYAKTLSHVLNVRANKLDKEVMRRLGKYIRAFNAKN
jgi:hypothetical protein